MDGLGGGERANAPADLHDKLLSQGIVDLIAILDSDERIDSLARELIINTDNGCLSDSGMLDESGLNLGSGQTVTADVDDVVNAASDPVESLVVTTSTITGELEKT